MSTRVPLFSVIVPTHDRPELLAAALSSVRRQTCPDLECIVVDDASSTPAVVPDDPRFRLVRRARRGSAAAARNDGLAVARGRFVTFLDDDDVMLPERLAAVTPLLASAPAVVCWQGRLETGEAQNASRIEGHAIRDVLGSAVNVAQVAVRRELVPDFDESFSVSEDVDWWFRLASVVPMTTVPEVLVLHRSHDGDRLTSRSEERARQRVRLLRKHRRLLRRYPARAARMWASAGDLYRRAGRDGDALRCYRRSFLRRPSRRAWRGVRTVARSRRIGVEGSRVVRLPLSEQRESPRDEAVHG